MTQLIKMINFNGLLFAIFSWCTNKPCEMRVRDISGDHSQKNMFDKLEFNNINRKRFNKYLCVSACFKTSFYDS
jgi:hypothetical protein